MAERRPTFEFALGDPDYPEQLRRTPDPPGRLFGIGDPGLLVPGLAVIGSRKSTPYGRAAARLFAGWAAAAGIVVVSGAAVGCDQAAHRAALDVRGSTVAVLGCGADIDYPKGAADLLAQIRCVGCVVSEQPWGAPPLRWAFARRNRIIAGLAHAVLVVEASVPSGTFSTADAAADAGRDVLAVPGSIFAPECRGANRLIRQGAIPITEVDDLVRALEIQDRVSDHADPLSLYSESREDPLLAALVANPMRPDDIANEFGLDIIDAVRRLSRLEADGLVSRLADGRYARA